MTPDQPTNQLPAAPEGYELFVPEIGDNVPHGCMIACPDDPSIPWEKEGAKKFAYYHFGPAHTFIFARPKSPAPSEAQPSGTEAQVCADIAARQQKGIEKYGTTVADNPLSFQQWLTHLYEEMLDAAVYAKRLLATPPAGELSETPRTDACESRVVEYDEYIKDKVIGDTVDTDFARQLERELALEFGWHVFQRDRANRLERELAALRQELEETRGEMPRDYKQAALELQAQLAAATSANETLRAALERMVELMAEKNDALAICYSDSHTLSLEWLRDKAGPDSIAPKCLENIRKWSDKWREGGKTLEAASKALAPSAGGEGGGL